MSPEKTEQKAARNKANYLAAKAAYNARDLDRCLEFYAPDHQIMSKSSPRGREHIRAFFEQTFASWPDVTLVVEHSLAEGDWVMGRSRSVATHSLPFMGVLPTHQKIETSFWDLHRFTEDGLIIETWNLTDSLAIIQALGLMPPK